MDWHEIRRERDDERRYKVFTLPTRTFAQLMRTMDGERLLRVEGWPDDAKIVGVGYDVAINGWGMAVWSASFPLVADNAMAPYEALTITELWPEPVASGYANPEDA